eukprot:TRINITY_DN8939_c0_g6_i1.p1 TRINITY_DN8939_c0_g6~~TRINITY_DN8939_c0_g6_i1.p1  ORF type:complete len:893 (+),score=193.77 TRINITY_DN8939_c0_g6_i1:175-2853(+)
MVAKVTPLDEVENNSPPRTSQTSSDECVVGDRRRLSFTDEAKVLMKTTGWYDSETAEALRRIVRGQVFGVAIGVALLLALFLPDVLSAIQVPSNYEQDTILIIILLMFAFEFIVLCATDASYLFGFFFFMDIVGTLSLCFDISYMLGDDATEPDVRYEGTASQDVVVVRAARAAKLGARAGRLSRVLKIVRFILPFLGGQDQDDKRVKMARIISRQLTHALSTRVAFLTIIIVVCMPVFSIFLFPENDFSMMSWSQHMDDSALEYDAARRARLGAPDGSAAAQAALSFENESREFFVSELRRFEAFYSEHDYGPFRICFGETDNGQGDFICKSDSLYSDLNLDNYLNDFQEPQRKSSIRVITGSRVQVFFNLAEPRVVEACMAVGLMVFVIGIMIAFGLVVSNSVGVIALQPLERMLSFVRETCSQIFKYTEELQENEDDDAEDDDDDYDDGEQTGEFELLDKAVSKIGSIVMLSIQSQVPVAKENMTEDEKMALGWTQGAEAPLVTLTAEDERNSEVLQPKNGLSGDLAGGVFKALPQHLIEEMDTMHFDSTQLTKETRLPVAMYLLCCTDGCKNWVQKHCKEEQLVKFVTLCESKYSPNPFHNFAHGLDTMFKISRFTQLIQARDFLSDQTIFWLLVSAIGHDLGHPGVNNEYLIETSHELAVKYNDKSPLENMHCSTLFQIMSEPDANIFRGVDKDNYKEIRKGIIAAILHTDMAQHFAMIKDLVLMFEMNSDAEGVFDPQQAISSPGNHQIVANALLHTADVNNPMKPFKLAQKLGMLCVDEFFAQGDLEKAAGMRVGMLNDRDKVNRPNSQIGFIDFMLVPLAESVVRMFPALDYLAENLASNIGKWCDLWEAEANPTAEALAKARSRVAKVQTRCRAVVVNHHQSS